MKQTESVSMTFSNAELFHIVVALEAATQHYKACSTNDLIGEKTKEHYRDRATAAMAIVAKIKAGG